MTTSKPEVLNPNSQTTKHLLERSETAIQTSKHLKTYSSEVMSKIRLCRQETQEKMQLVVIREESRQMRMKKITQDLPDFAKENQSDEDRSAIAYDILIQRAKAIRERSSTVVTRSQRLQESHQALKKQNLMLNQPDRRHYITRAI